MAYKSTIISTQPNSNIIETCGIHETQLYKNAPQGSYEYKGWYFASKFSLVSGKDSNIIDEICKNHYKVLLGDTQQAYSTISNIDPQTQSNASSDILAKLSVGDILTFKNSSNYIDSIEVLAISGNCLTFKYIPGKFLNNPPTKRNLPQLQSYTTDNPLNASVRCNAKPDAGPTLISGGSTATNIGGGSNTTRGYFATTIGGSCNTNSGDFTVVGGENNIVNGKSSIILGIDNSNNQEKNYVLGNKIDTQYREGYVLGRHLTTTNNHQTIIGLGNDTSYDNNYSVVIATGWDVGDIAGEAGIYSNYNSIEATQSNLTLRAVDGVSVDSKNSISINAGGAEAKSYITMDRQFLYTHGQYTTFAGETVKINSSTATLNAPNIELTGQSLGTNINIGTGSLTNNSGFTVTVGKGLTRDEIENDQRTQVIVGQYNQAVGNGKVSGTPCFIVGNGSSSVKHNAIEVYTDKINISGQTNFVDSGISMQLMDSGEDALNNDVLINNSTGITITPSLAAQLKHKVGNVHIDGSSISINPAGNEDDWGIGKNYPELFECGSQLKMTNSGIELYDEYNDFAVKINAHGIQRVSNWRDFTISGVTQIDLRDSGESTTKFQISSSGLSSYNTDNYIGCNNMETDLYYAKVGKYELTGLLTSKTIYNSSGETLITPSDYTNALLDKLSTQTSGEVFNPETESYDFSYVKDTTNFEKVAVGLDYFYNVIKELNDRIAALEAKLQ